MQDKIQEIMGLVDAAIMGAEGHEATGIVRDAIESKLRELVREPLSDADCEEIFWDWVDGPCSEIDLVRAIERAHGITNTSGAV